MAQFTVQQSSPCIDNLEQQMRFGHPPSSLFQNSFTVLQGSVSLLLHQASRFRET